MNATNARNSAKKFLHNNNIWSSEVNIEPRIEPEEVYHEIYKAVHRGEFDVQITIADTYQDFILYCLNEDCYQIQRSLSGLFRISW